MRKLRFGVLGTGHIIGKAGPALQQAANGEWIGVAGRNAENGRKAADTYGVPNVYASYAELLDDPEIDAVYIALLNHLHAEWAEEAVRKGKHVLLEKPFTMNAADSQKIVDLAKANNVHVEEAFVSRYQEGHHFAKAAIRDGAIGDAVYFRGHFAFTAQEHSTRLVNEWGGGGIYDIGCYLVNWSRYLFGEEPESADCRLIRKDGDGVDMRYAGTLQFPGGGTALLTGGLDMPYGCGYEVLGTKGKLEVKQTANAQAVTLQVTVNGETSEFTTDRITPFRLQAEQFARHILEGNYLPDGGEAIMAQARVLDALFASDATRSRIRIG